MQTEIEWIMIVKTEISIHSHCSHGIHRSTIQIHIVHIHFVVAAEPHFIEIVISRRLLIICLFATPNRSEVFFKQWQTFFCDYSQSTGEQKGSISQHLQPLIRNIRAKCQL